jgi:hypothetical protein
MFICFSTVRADAPATEISFNFSVVGGSRRRQKLPPRQWLPCRRGTYRIVVRERRKHDLAG